MELQTPKDLECMAPGVFGEILGLSWNLGGLHLGPDAVDVIMADAQDLFFCKKMF